MNRISAFTIVELIVTLIIGSIITGIIYYCYILFSNQFIKYHENSAWVNEFMLFEKSFQQDIDKADIVRDSASNRLILENHSNENSIFYEFNDSSVFRRTSKSENLFLLKAGLINYNYLTDSIRLIKNIVISCGERSDKIEAVFGKYYSSQQIIKYQSKIE